MAGLGDPPLVMIGVDAAEITVLERLLAAGRLPNIARLRRQGSRAVLEHRHGGLQSSVWRTFITGQPVTGHGCYFAKMWRPALMRLEHVDDSWPPVTPFWDRPGPRPLKVGLIDIPYLPALRPADGLLLSGWQCHDILPRTSWPRDLWGELEAKFGPPVLGEEVYGPQSPATLLRARAGALAAPGQIAEICAWLLGRERYDLFAVVLGSAHRAGHYLWDLSQIDADALPDADRSALEDAVEDVYVACDAAVGRIVGAAPAGARIVLLAMHGMGPNAGWNENVAPLLELAAGDAAPAARGLRDRLRAAHASPLGRRLSLHMPRGPQKLLSRLWLPRSRDWSRTPFLNVPSDVNAYVRLNLRGREAAGIVAPGEEAEALLQRLADGFMALEDLETGERVCRGVELIDDIDGPDAPCRAGLPDLVALWADRQMLGSVGIRRRGGGERRWRRITRFVSGRAGNHRPDGWMIVSGTGTNAGLDLGRIATLDAIAALAAWSGRRPPSGLAAGTAEALVGSPIPA